MKFLSMTQMTPTCDIKVQTFSVEIIYFFHPSISLSFIMHSGRNAFFHNFVKVSIILVVDDMNIIINKSAPLKLTVQSLSAIVCVINAFLCVAISCCQLVFECSVGIGAFVIGLSQISLFFSKYYCAFFASQKLQKCHLNHASNCLQSVNEISYC